jgi:hypothetical protein
MLNNELKTKFFNLSRICERNLSFSELINGEWKKSEHHVYSTQILQDTCVQRHYDVVYL